MVRIDVIASVSLMILAGTDTLMVSGLRFGQAGTLARLSLDGSSNFVECTETNLDQTGAETGMPSECVATFECV